VVATVLPPEAMFANWFLEAVCARLIAYSVMLMIFLNGLAWRVPREERVQRMALKTCIPWNTEHSCWLSGIYLE
jgi:hypothetical protein